MMVTVDVGFVICIPCSSCCCKMKLTTKTSGTSSGTLSSMISTSVHVSRSSGPKVMVEVDSTKSEPPEYENHFL